MIAGNYIAVDARRSSHSRTSVRCPQSSVVSRRRPAYRLAGRPSNPVPPGSPRICEGGTRGSRAHRCSRRSRRRTVPERRRGTSSAPRRRGRVGRWSREPRLSVRYLRGSIDVSVPAVRTRTRGFVQIRSILVRPEWMSLPWSYCWNTRSAGSHGAGLIDRFEFRWIQHRAGRINVGATDHKYFPPGKQLWRWTRG